MKKHLVIFVAVLLAVAAAMPAFAAVEFKYGGQFRVRFQATDNVSDGTEFQQAYSAFTPGVVTQSKYNSDDNRNWMDQRLRLYFSFVASPNLKVVTKYELGDATWGQGGTLAIGSRVGPNLGANLGADSVSVEVKNAYIEFNIPNTPTTALIGVQTTTLMDSWIVDDDLPAAIFVTRLNPFKIAIGYVGGQNGWERDVAAVSPGEMVTTDQKFNVDDVFLSVDYVAGPWKASGVLFFQDAHSSFVSADPSTMQSPVSTITGTGAGNFVNLPAGANLNAAGAPIFGTGATTLQDNFLFDLGINITYKVDYLLAYVNFVKNFGSAGIMGIPVSTIAAGHPTGVLSKMGSFDYTGFMIDAGVTYFCGPWTANIGGFYISGPDIDSVIANNGINATTNGAITGAGGSAPGSTNTNARFTGLSSTDANWFVYPLATVKYFSEIIGGGVIGDGAADSQAFPTRGYKFGSTAGTVGTLSGVSTVYWRGSQFPTNLWTVTVGGSYQVAPRTKISGSYWYFGTANSVPVAYDPGSVVGTAATRYQMSSSIGHELDLYLDQGIVDGLTLTLVGAYLIADDAFAPLAYGAPNSTVGSNINYFTPHADNAFKIGARLQWNF